LYSRATERKKDKKWTKKGNFLANGKSLNHFNGKIRRKTSKSFKNHDSLNEFLNKTEGRKEERVKTGVQKTMFVSGRSLNVSRSYFVFPLCSFCLSSGA